MSLFVGGILASPMFLGVVVVSLVVLFLYSIRVDVGGSLPFLFGFVFVWDVCVFTPTQLPSVCL